MIQRAWHTCSYHEGVEKPSREGVPGGYAARRRKDDFRSRQIGCHSLCEEDCHREETMLGWLGHARTRVG